MVNAGPPPAKRLGAAAREELADARLLLETAAHNVAAALRQADAQEARNALGTALEMAGQAHSALARVAAGLG